MTSASERVDTYLDRIAAVDPLIRSVCTIDPSAAEQARVLDAESDQGRARGPLHGLPVLVKDNVDTAGLATTAGSLALSEVGGAQPPTLDAPIVARLRAAGLIVLGKANLSEWANFRDPASTSGWSGHGGLTRNPYGRNRSAGGSSAGSGAAIAAGLAPLAIGTETDGSITCPAALNGCVGIKPTVGLLPSTGIVPISSSQDAPGPMAPTVAAAAALLSVLAGDGIDYAAHAGAADALDRLAGARIGVPRAPWWGYSDHADAVGEEALRFLSQAGATIVEVDGPGELDGDAELTVLLAEFAAGLPAYLETRSGTHPRTLAELIAFNREHAAVELAHFGQGILDSALEAPGLDSAAYLEARDLCRRTAGGEGIDRVVGEHGLDALLTPSYAPAWPIDLVNAEHAPGGCPQATAMAGYPLVTVPMRLAGGLPVAVSLWGRARSEARLIELAAGLEAARDRELGVLPAPTFPDFV